MPLQGKVVFITGASSGIGEALAREFFTRGANLSLFARRKERLDKLVEELKSPHQMVRSYRGDVTRDEDLPQVLEQTQKEIGPVDVVVANAGFGVVGKFESLSLEDYRRQFETNVYGVLRTIQAALPQLKQTHGRVAVMGSVAGFASLPQGSPYSMSKFAIRALCDALRDELRVFGISVTHLAPGFVESEIRFVDNEGRIHSTGRDPIPKFLLAKTPVVAKQMVRAIELRKREKVLTGHGKLIVWLRQHWSTLYFCLVSWMTVSARREPR